MKNYYKIIDVNGIEVLYTKEAISSRMIPEGLYLYDIVKKTDNKGIITDFDSITTPSIFGGTLISYKELNINDQITLDNGILRTVTLDDYMSNYIKLMKILLLNDSKILDDEIYEAKVKAMKKIIAKYYDRNEDDITIWTIKNNDDPNIPERNKNLLFIETMCEAMRDSTHIVEFPNSITHPIISQIISFCEIPRIDWMGIRSNPINNDPELKEYFDVLFGDSRNYNLMRRHMDYIYPSFEYDEFGNLKPSDLI